MEQSKLLIRLEVPDMVSLRVGQKAYFREPGNESGSLVRAGQYSKN